MFIDYGKNWEYAWLEHLQSWKAPNIPINGSYASIKEFRESKDIRTVHELKSNPYPANIMLVCYFPECSKGDDFTEEIDFNGGRLKSDIGVEKENQLHACDIVENKPYSLTVRITCLSGSKFLVTSYSKDLVTFRMKAYASDQHLDGAFRHYIEIDDNLFPEQWKNINEDGGMKDEL